jgi:hypothetical protein
VAKHRLIWLENRNTPKVLPSGSKPYQPKPSEGKVVKSRPATEQEEKEIARGDWIRVDRHGRRPGHPNYGTGSKVRPQFDKKKKD